MIAACHRTSTLPGMLVTAALLRSKVMAPEAVSEPVAVNEPIVNEPVAVTEPVTMHEPASEPVAESVDGMERATFGHPHVCFPRTEHPAIARERPPAPRIRIMFAPATVVAIGDGYLDKAIIRRYLRRQHERIAYCFERHGANPDVVMTASFTILEQGTTADVHVAGEGGVTASCIAAVIQHIEFPSPKGTGRVEVSVPLTFALASPATHSR